MGTLSGQSERLLPGFRAAFAWLAELGFAETEADVSRGLLSLHFVGPAAQVGVSAELGHNCLLTFLAPAGEDYWQSHVALGSLLEARGHHVSLARRVVPSSDEHWLEVATSYSDALRLLRGTELVGDWSATDRAREITAARRDAQFDQLIAAFGSDTRRADVVRGIRDRRRR